MNYSKIPVEYLDTPRISISAREGVFKLAELMLLSSGFDSEYQQHFPNFSRNPSYNNARTTITNSKSA
jgi:hypothetical protein